MDEWIVDKDRQTGDLEGFAAPWRKPVEGWGSGCEASTRNHWQNPHCHQVFLFCFIFHRILSSNGFPESWGESMHEVVAGDPKQKEGTLWSVNFFQLPNIGELCEYGPLF